jgi:hypothetical protein
VTGTQSETGAPRSAKTDRAAGAELDVQALIAYLAGMKRRQTAEAIQYTLRNVPPALDRALRRRAKQLSKSLNEVALEALTLGAGVSHEVREQHDVDFLFGSWVEDPEVDRALADQRKIDADLWR